VKSCIDCGVAKPPMQTIACVAARKIDEAFAANPENAPFRGQFPRASGGSQTEHLCRF
jgi:hypothetical protein